MNALLLTALFACALLHTLAQSDPAGHPAAYHTRHHDAYHPRAHYQPRKREFSLWNLIFSASDEFYSNSHEHYYRMRRDADDLARVKAM